MRGLTRTLFIFGAVVALVACGGPPSEPEEELRTWVADGMEAAAAKERRKLVDMVSAAYVDGRGNERADIENMLRYYFLRQQKIALVSNIEEITVYDGTAAAIVLTVGMAGTSGGVMGFSADAYRFALELETGADEWQLISARWGELGDELR